MGLKTQADLMAERDFLLRLMDAEHDACRKRFRNREAKIAAKAAIDDLIAHLDSWAAFPARFELFRAGIDEMFAKLDESVSTLYATGKPFHHLSQHPAHFELMASKQHLRGLAAVDPNLAFHIEVRMYRMGLSGVGSSHLRAAVLGVGKLMHENLDAQIETRKAELISARNRRTGPRKPPAHCRGFYWDAAGRLQYDDARQAQLRLDCTQKSALSIIEYFERTRGTKRGAKAFAMKLLGIKDGRTFDSLPSESDHSL